MRAIVRSWLLPAPFRSPATRFQSGRSGNPRGRPKGSRNIATTLARELSAVITIQENGKRRRITKLDAIMKQQVNKAASGDNRSAQFILGLTQAIESSPAPSTEPLSSEADEQTKRELLHRIHRLAKQVTASSDDNT